EARAGERQRDHRNHGHHRGHEPFDNGPFVYQLLYGFEIGYRQSGIEVHHLAAHGGRHRGGLGGGSHDYSHIASWILGIGDVNARLGDFIEPVFNIADHAGNFQRPVRLAVSRDPSPDEFPIREVAAREGLIDDYDSRGLFIVLRIEVATAFERHAYGAEVSRRHHANACVWLFAFLERRVSGDRKIGPGVASRHWQSVDRANGHNSRERLQTLGQLVEKDAAFLFRVFFLGQPDLKAKRVVRIESDILTRHRREATQHQSSAGQ